MVNWKLYETLQRIGARKMVMCWEKAMNYIYDIWW